MPIGNAYAHVVNYVFIPHHPLIIRDCGDVVVFGVSMVNQLVKVVYNVFMDMRDTRRGRDYKHVHIERGVLCVKDVIIPTMLGINTTAQGVLLYVPVGIVL